MKHLPLFLITFLFCLSASAQMQVKQSSTDKLIFYAVDETDLVTPEEGLSVTVEISKDGGAFASPSSSVTEISDGFYYIANTTDTGTVGPLVLRATATGAVIRPMLYQVVANTTDDIATTLAALNDLDAAGIRTAVGLASANLDTQIAALPTAAENRAEMDSNSTQLAAIVADTNELQTDDYPTTLATLATSSALATVDSNVDAILVDTGTTIPAQITALNNISAAQVNAEVDTALSDYDPPTKAEMDAAIAAITPGTVTGAYSVTLTVTDGTDPLENAKVRVAEGATVEVYSTNAAGQATITRDAATYSIRITKPGYSFTETTRTVTGEESGTITTDLEMTALTIPAAPDDPELCRVYVYADTITNVNSTGLSIKVGLSTFPSKAGTVNQRQVATLTITDGYGYVDLRRTDEITPSGSLYRFTCPDLGLNHTTALEASTFDLSTLIE